MWRRSGALAAGLVIFALICAASLNKPLASDEAEFGAAARGIVLRGQPLYYVGDVPEPYVDPHDAWITRSTPLPGYQYGLWHSSYYLYCIALSYRCFGFHDFAVRLVGVVCALLTFALLVRFLRAHTQGDWKGSLPWLALLYLTNPYITQMSMMVDFDNTVMTFASVLFLHEYVRLRGRAGVASFLWLAWLVAFSAWSKEYAPVYLGASLLAFHALQRQGKELLRAAAIVLLGLFLFAASWWAFCRLRGIKRNSVLMTRNFRDLQLVTLNATELTQGPAIHHIHEPICRRAAHIVFPGNHTATKIGNGKGVVATIDPIGIGRVSSQSGIQSPISVSTHILSSTQQPARGSAGAGIRDHGPNRNGRTTCRCPATISSQKSAGTGGPRSKSSCIDDA